MNLLQGEESVIGFRPEHLVPAGGQAEASPSTLSLPFRVEHEEYLGSERILYGRLAGGAFDGEKAVSRLPATFHAGAESGAVLQFQVERRKLKYFDRETGRRRDPVRVP
jgi:multiple sugar transport system ATP-binding protein